MMTRVMRGVVMGLALGIVGRSEAMLGEEGEFMGQVQVSPPVQTPSNYHCSDYDTAKMQYLSVLAARANRTTEPGLSGRWDGVGEGDEGEGICG